MAKSDQLQIRVSPAQKTALKKAARRAGVDVSSYVLARVLPQARTRVLESLDALRRGADRRFALAELSDILSSQAPAALAEVVADWHVSGLSPFLQNYVAAMVEHAANGADIAPPSWTRAIEPLDDPYFAVPFVRLRPHLLRASPPAFKRRNLFVDATVGDRV
jgi:uncharacterized protein (DUF1778 family)